MNIIEHSTVTPKSYEFSDREKEAFQTVISRLNRLSAEVFTTDREIENLEDMVFVLQDILLHEEEPIAPDVEGIYYIPYNE